MGLPGHPQGSGKRQGKGSRSYSKGVFGGAGKAKGPGWSPGRPAEELGITCQQLGVPARFRGMDQLPQKAAARASLSEPRPAPAWPPAELQERTTP